MKIDGVLSIQTIDTRTTTKNEGFKNKIESSANSENEKVNNNNVVEDGPVFSFSTPADLQEKSSTTFNQAAFILQTIVSEKLTDKVIRKMPSDEYVQLLSLLDNMVSGSIHKEV
jgi:hypothetical protein